MPEELEPFAEWPNRSGEHDPAEATADNARQSDSTDGGATVPLLDEVAMHDRTDPEGPVVQEWTPGEIIDAGRNIAGQAAPALPEGWLTFWQFAQQTPVRVPLDEVRAVANYLVTGMTAEAEDSQAQPTLMAERRMPSEAGGTPRVVTGLAPKLASAIRDFYSDLEQGVNPNDTSAEHSQTDWNQENIIAYGKRVIDEANN